MVEAIGAALAGDPRVELLGLFTTYYSIIDSICIRKTIYLHAPYVGIFLGGGGVCCPFKYVGGYEGPFPIMDTRLIVFLYLTGYG